MLQENPSLGWLSLRGACLSRGGAESLISGLWANVGLTGLNLEWTSLKTAHVSALAAALQGHTALLELHLTLNRKCKDDGTLLALLRRNAALPEAWRFVSLGDLKGTVFNTAARKFTIP